MTRLRLEPMHLVPTTLYESRNASEET